MLAGAIVVTLMTSILATAILVLRLQPELTRVTVLIRDLRLSHEAMLDQETGLRAYLATGDAAFLDPYRKGQHDAAVIQRHLLDLLEEGGSEVGTIVRTLQAEQSWRDRWAVPAAATPAAGIPKGAELAAYLRRGKVLFDQYRKLQAISMTIATLDRDDLQARQRRALFSAGVVNLTVVTGLLLVDLRRRRRLSKVVDGPVSDLLARMRRIHDGLPVGEPMSYDVEEFRTLGEGLHRMSESLNRELAQGAARETAAAVLAERLRVILRVARETAGSQSLRYVAEAVGAGAVELGGERAVIWVRDAPNPDFVAVRRSQDPHGVRPPHGLTAPVGVVRASDEARVVHSDDSAFYPLVVGGNVVGVLEVEGVGLDGDDAEQIDSVLEALALNAASALESARLHAVTARQATIDALTGLPNRRSLEADLAKEWERSRRYGRPLSLVMLDVDHFKQVNDGAGHAVGDIWLQRLGELLQRALRDSDSAYRYGGEEFLLMLPETTAEDATVLAERIRAAVETTVGPSDLPHVTVSMGVSAAASDMTGQHALVAAADRALYAAKRSGRNQVVTSQEGVEPAEIPLPRVASPEGTEVSVRA